MSTYTSEVRRKFYDQVWLRALVGGNHWCRAIELADDTIALLPAERAAPEQITLWPTLAPGWPGWIPTAEKIEAAFTAVLRVNGPAVDLGNPVTKRKLGLAEQHLDAGELSPAQAELLLQVAVFGRVVFS